MSPDNDFTCVGLISVSVIVFSMLHPIRSLTEGLTNSLCVYSTPCAENSYWCYPNLNGAQPHCNCLPGFNRSTYISYGAWNCADIDECSGGITRCLGSSHCVNTPGGYKCQCGPGQAYSGTRCADVDECQSGVHHCGFGTYCVNTDGAYRCECQDPSKPVLRSAKSGTFFCEIVCSRDGGACSYNSWCVGNGTDFVCRCRRGFILSVEGICEDTQDCDRRDPCAENSVYCTYNGRPRCICEEGYERDRRVGNNAIACRDIDECLDPNVCRDTSVCENTAGGFRCVCPEGYQYIDQRCRQCEKRESCGQNAVYCYYGETSTCICEKGFIFNNMHGANMDCKDVNECSSSPGPCGSGTDCVNTHGSFKCNCRAGFIHQTGDPHTCQDINECNSTEFCQNNATCFNTPGSFLCVCEDGFELREDRCEDIDECQNGTSNQSACNPNTECNNLVGSYECVCAEGYAVGNGTSCEDIDECQSDHECGFSAECRNTNGSYECACPEGFDGDGFECQDIDECALDSHECGQWGECLNTNGSYECVCPEGFAGEGFLCTDIDECQSDFICGGQARCRNTNGSFECECIEGYSGDGYLCYDVDECLESSACGAAEECVNVIGDYECRPAKSEPKTKDPDMTGVDLDETRNTAKWTHSTPWPLLVVTAVYTVHLGIMDRRGIIVSSH